MAFSQKHSPTWSGSSMTREAVLFCCMPILALSPSSLFTPRDVMNATNMALRRSTRPSAAFFPAPHPLPFLSADGGHRFLPPPITGDTIHFPSKRFQIVVHFLHEFGRNLAVPRCCLLDP